MSNTVLEVGTGVFIIALVWIAALVFGTMLLRASGSAKLGIVPVVALAVIITVTLVLFPRSPETPPPFKEIEIVDHLFIGRYLLLALSCCVLLLGFFLLLPLDYLEPVYAKALRT